MLATKRVKTPRKRGPGKGMMGACSKCADSIQLMCADRCNAGRAVLCEVMTDEEREFEYATSS